MTMTKNQKTPKLRFPGFSGAWEKVRLSDVAGKGEYGLGAAAKKYDGETRYLRITDINDESHSFNTAFVTSSGIRNDLYLLKPNDFVVARTGASTGKSYLYDPDDGKVQFAGFLIRFRVNNADPQFVFAQTLRRTYQKWVAVVSARSGQPGINAEEYSGYEFYAPKKEEQEKIAEFLGVVDGRISALQKKVELMKKYKKGVMQKIFSQEIRFKNENGKDYPAWQVKLGNEIFQNVSERNNGQKLPILAITQDKGAVPRDQINYDISVTDASVDNYKVVRKGDFIISLRSFQGGIEYSDYDGICSPAYIILRSSVPIDKHFYKYFLKTRNYIQRLTRKLEGIRDGKMISFKYFSDASLPYPALQEQKKIANILTAIDEKINLTERELEQAKQFKKALLQQMFV